jgi:hypothetical protein
MIGEGTVSIAVAPIGFSGDAGLLSWARADRIFRLQRNGFSSELPPMKRPLHCKVGRRRRKRESGTPLSSWSMMNGGNFPLDFHCNCSSGSLK